MKQIIDHLEKTIKDTHFSKSEAKVLKELLEKHVANNYDFQRIQNAIFNLADKSITPQNYKHTLKWLEDVNKSLLSSITQQSEAYFSPGSECRDVIIEQILSAKKYLNICVFTISDNVLSDAILSAHYKGINVRIITDNDKLHDFGSDIDHLARKGLSIKTDFTDNHMHHKFAIVDGISLITGSYNWTRSAMAYNHENVLISRDANAIKMYQDEFESLWTEMVPFKT